MRKLEFLMVLILVVLTTFFLFLRKERQLYRIELCIPDINYSSEYIRSADTTSTYTTFKLEEIKLTPSPEENEINSAEIIIGKLIKNKKYRTGIVIDISKTNYNGFIDALNIFIKNNIRKVCFQDDKIYYFPCRPPKEFMRNRMYVNKDF